MTQYTLRQADHDDVPAYWDLISQTVDWLRSIGSDQWFNWTTWQGADGKVARAIRRGAVWLVFADDKDPAATVTLERDGDPDFWTPDDLRVSARYISKLAVRRDHSGHGLGRLLLNWAGDRAARDGASLVRLDAWRANARLQRYYLDQGWQFVRLVEAAHRQSGALFERSAVPMPAQDRARLVEQRKIDVRARARQQRASPR